MTDTKDMQDALNALGDALTRAVQVCGALVVLHVLGREIAGLCEHINVTLSPRSNSDTNEIMN
jgi:hypothetical protein